jgi:hypothetical protein
MYELAAVLGIAIMLIVLFDGFQTIVLPRRVTQSIRLTRIFYLGTWAPWRWLAHRIKQDKRRENFLGYYGPLSLLFLLIVWAWGLIVAFSLLQWSLGTDLKAPEVTPSFWTDLYMSGVTFFTLGFGDVVPANPVPRAVAVAEAGVGFGFLAVIIGYLPVMYQAFSQREISVSLLDERAGSPPTAVELLRRLTGDETSTALIDFLRDWERWSAELLESHLSYPVLGYFRSQHDSQSWVASLTMVLDTCALMMVGIEGVPRHQAQLTFAMARHAAVDLTQVFDAPPQEPDPPRMVEGDMDRLHALLAASGIICRNGDEAKQQMLLIREQYEPYVNALARRLVFTLPPWVPEEGARDVWQITAWEETRTTNVR